MMKLFGRFLKENIRNICLYIGFTGIFYIVFELYGVRNDAVGYAFLLTTFWLFSYGMVEFVRYVRHHRKLLETEKRAVEGFEGMPVSSGLIEADYQRILRVLYEEKLEIESKNRIARQEMTDYYQLWVHQIKTPIAALHVLIQTCEESGDGAMNPLIRDMKLELFKIEQYAEMVLTYLRMESMTSDLSFGTYSLDHIIRQAVRKYSRMFILQKIKLNYKSIEKKVLTDEKWLCFVIEQLLSNALKYTLPRSAGSAGACITGCPDGYTLPRSAGSAGACITGCPDGYTGEGTVSIYMKGNFLVIEDNGIGIYPEDLPRVFERGFTGYNGRSDKKSTGIGLYLCKSIMDKLKHEIWIESEPGEGTRVYLGLERKELWME